MSSAADEAAKLEAEATRLIERVIMKLEEGWGSEAAKRLVECIVSAAVLRAADIMSAACSVPSTAGDHNA